MVRSILFICILLAVSSPSLAQWGTGDGMRERLARAIPAPGSIVGDAPRVVFDLLAFKRSANAPGRFAGGPSDSTRMDLYFAVDYNSLEFLYAIDKYVADYSVTIQIMTGGNLILDRYEAYTVLESTIEHHARTQYAQSRADAQQISFLLTPGTAYTMRLSVQDHASRNSFDTSFDFNVKDLGGSSPSMSDLMIYRDRSGSRIVPSIGPDVSSMTGRSSLDEQADYSSKGIFAELYNMPADSTVGIVTEIVSAHSGNALDTGSFVSRATTTLPIAPANSAARTAPASTPVTPLFAPVSFDGVWTGYYWLHTFVLPSARDTSLNDLSTLETRAITSAKRKILVTIAQGIPISAGDLDRAIEQLGVIATGAEWDSLSHARTPRQKRDAILDFWRKKNAPSSMLASSNSENRAMEVFYSRVEYANAHFGTTFQAGWKSDRGRVYIAYGPPDLIDSHPEGYEASSTMRQAYGGLQAPYEVWQYSTQGMRYIFVDEYMLGDYRLRGAFPPEGTFVWQ